VNAHVIADCEGSFATVAEAFSPAPADDSPWWVPVNCALLRSGDATVLVDTGIGAKPRQFLPDADARLLDELGALGVAPADVGVVVHTHLHIDHVGWDGAFPNARYVVHEDEWSYFMSEESLAQRPHLRERLLPQEVERVRGGEEIAPGVFVEPTPGHTPGHIAVRAGDVAVIGDAIVSALQAADPEVTFVNDMDAAQAVVTRKRLLDELTADGARVIAGHLVGIGRFERSGKGFRWTVE
jgi:glyoxylase-like metal-dependent hydrolase (beta-lactamase superfamily II)